MQGRARRRLCCIYAAVDQKAGRVYGRVVFICFHAVIPLPFWICECLIIARIRSLVCFASIDQRPPNNQSRLAAARLLFLFCTCKHRQAARMQRVLYPIHYRAFCYCKINSAPARRRHSVNISVVGFENARARFIPAANSIESCFFHAIIPLLFIAV